MPLRIQDYIASFRDRFLFLDATIEPWKLTADVSPLIGDHSRIGANAVLSPGTILAPHTVVARLELVDQGGG